MAIQSTNADRHLLAPIVADIMESDFPYLCDIFYLEEIKNPQLLEHIKRVGKVLYEKLESGCSRGCCDGGVSQFKIEDLVQPLTTIDPQKVAKHTVRVHRCVERLKINQHYPRDNNVPWIRSA